MDTAEARAALQDRLTNLDGELAELTAVPLDPMSAVSFGKRVGDGTTEAVDRLTKVGTADQLSALKEALRANRPDDAWAGDLRELREGMEPVTDPWHD